MKWMNLLLFLFLFLLLRMHFITKTKGIELCHFPWALVTFVTQDNILMSDWRLSSCSFLPSCWFFFYFFTFFPCIKYHELVWFTYKWRNFITMQHYYFFVIFPFDSCDVPDHKLWPKAEFIILADAMTKGLISPPFQFMVMMSPITGYLVLYHLSWCHFYWISFLLLTSLVKKRFRS